MSSNGLFPSTAVCSSGEPTSSFYVRKGEAIQSAVVQPQLTVLSASGLQTATLSINNAGLTTLVGAGAVEIESASSTIDAYTDAGFYSQPLTSNAAATINLQNGTAATTPSRITFYNTSATGGGNTSGDLGVYGYTGSGLLTTRRLFGVTAIGSTFDVGDATTVGGAVLNVNGPSGAGRVYDTKYNTLDTVTTVTASSKITAPKFCIPSSSAYSGAVALNGTSVTVGISAGITSDSQILITPTSGPVGRLFATYVNDTSFTINSTNSETNVTVMYLVIPPA